jgi:hypothetical protein
MLIFVFMPFLVYFFGMHGVGFGFVKLVDLFKATSYGRRFKFRFDYFQQATTIDSRKYEDDTYKERCLSMIIDVLSSVYKIGIVIIFLIFCVSLGALIALVALLPSYFLFIQIVVRVTLNWSKTHRID